MTFREQYAELEREFQEQVERDKKYWNTSYVHNFIPKGPVNYIFIAMEPSTGVPGGSPRKRSKKEESKKRHKDRNFSWSVEDFIFHYCIREYLCQDGETYHLTDLGKGNMTIEEANRCRHWRYDRWYSLLEKEIHLLTKPGKTRLIAIGNQVAHYLKKKPLGKHLEKVRHYGRLSLTSVDKAIESWRKEFPAFSQTVDKSAIDESVKEVLRDACMESSIPHRPEGGKPINLTESRKKLMFYYKNRFSEIRMH